MIALNNILNGHPKMNDKIPEPIQTILKNGATTILSCSGGKDSTATGLYLKELDIPFQAIFCDTGWEHEDTYRYLCDVLPGLFGEIKWLTGGHKWPEKLKIPLLRDSGASKEEIDVQERAEAARMAATCEEYAREIEALLFDEWRPSEFVRRALQKAVFPARVLRWCTQETKFFPARDFLATLDHPLNVVGIRHEESRARSEMPEYEFDSGLDSDVWRPIIRWTLDDVIEIHKRHGVTPNPLYLRNASRVGCYPCIFSRKSEIAMVDDRRVSAIRLLEARVAELANIRHTRRDPAGSRKQPTFFQADRADESGSWHWPIDKVVEWSKTGRGGRQFELFAASPRDAGCMRWGLCDTGAHVGPFGGAR